MVAAFDALCPFFIHGGTVCILYIGSIVDVWREDSNAFTYFENKCCKIRLFVVFSNNLESHFYAVFSRMYVCNILRIQKY